MSAEIVVQAVRGPEEAGGEEGGEDEEGEEAGGGEAGGGGVEGTVGALIAPAHLTDTKDVQRCCVESLHDKLLWPQRLYQHCLSGTRQVGHRVVPAI